MSRPVVMVHGLASSSASTWRPTGLATLIEELGRPVVQIDLLGHGTAEQPHDPERFADLAGWLADRFPDEPCDVVAFSLGARLTLEVAGRRLAPIHSMILLGVGANLFADAEDARASTEALAAALAGETDGDDPAVAHFLRLCATSGSDPRSVAALLRRPPSGGWPPDWSSITAPTVVIVGDADFAGPADPLVAALPDARAVVVPRTDHFSLPKAMMVLDTVLDTLVDMA